MRFQILGLILITMSCSLFAQTISQGSSLNRFSFDLYHELKEDGKNLFFSPLSIDIALLMTAEGARKQTRKEFEKVLYLNKHFTSERLGQQLMKLSNSTDKDNQLTIANAIWFNYGFKIKPDYRKLLNVNYQAKAESLNFGKNVESAEIINKWVLSQTNNMIKELIKPDDLNPKATSLVLTNAVYFSGEWAKSFDTTLTHLDDFKVSKNETVKMNFMVDSSNYFHYETDEYQFIEIPYKNRTKSLYIFLPRDDDGLQALENVINAQILPKRSGIPGIVHLSLPKFDLEMEYDLKKPLIKMGLVTAFGSADFSGISDERLFISKVIHKTALKIDEKKTVAAAATAVNMAKCLPPDPITFKADHPFLFAIMDNETNSILFLGRFVKP